MPVVYMRDALTQTSLHKGAVLGVSAARRYYIWKYRERSGSVVSSAWLETEGSRVRALPASLRCGPWARHIYPSLELVQPGKTRPRLTERLLMGREESNQTYGNGCRLREISSSKAYWSFFEGMWAATWDFQWCSRHRRVCTTSFQNGVQSVA